MTNETATIVSPISFDELVEWVVGMRRLDAPESVAAAALDADDAIDASDLRLFIAAGQSD